MDSNLPVVQDTEIEFSNKVASGYNFFAYIKENQKNDLAPVRGKAQNNPGDEARNTAYLYIFGDTQNLTSYDVVPGKKMEIINEANLNVITRVNHKDKDKESYNQDKINPLESYEPIQVSANKLSVAAVFKQSSKNENENAIKNSKLDLEKLKIIGEIRDSLKARNLTYQGYFLGDIVNESLFATSTGTGGKKGESSGFFISEYELKEKIINLINNVDKHQEDIFRMLDILKSKGSGGKLDLLLLFLVVCDDKPKNFEVELFKNTKLFIAGEFAANCMKEMQNKEYFDRWKEYYQTYFIYELPILLLPIKQVEVGENHILILTIDGYIYSWGDGSLGATGNGIKEFHITPSRVIFAYEGNSNVFVTRIACGSRHSMALDKNYSLYSWGFGQKGRLGHGNDENERYPRVIGLLSNSKVENFDAGDNYSACITETKQLYTWGAGEFGRLGHGGTSDELSPRKVTEINDIIVHVKCGYFSMVVFGIKNVYLVGAKYLFLPEESEVKDDENIPKVDFKSSKQDGEDNGKINFIKPIDPGPLKIRNCITGYQYIALFGSKDGSTSSVELYLMGNIRLNSKKIETKFKSILSDASISNTQDIYASDSNKPEKAKRSEGVKKVICGENNTLVLSYDGDIYVFGSFLYKLASEHFDQYNIPIFPRKENIKVRSMALGSNHIIIVSESYDVYGWGKNKEGQLGLGYTCISVDKPVIIERLKNKGVKKVYCSDNYSAAVSSANDLYFFGDISFMENSQYINYQILPKLFFWKGFNIMKIACGPSHILFVFKDDAGHTKIGALGNGTYGKLGNNNEDRDNAYTPVIVDFQNNEDITNCEKPSMINIKCSRLTSVALITSCKDRKSKKLWMWGASNKNLFDQPKIRDFMNREGKESKKKKIKMSSELIELSSPWEVTQWKNIKKVALSDTSVYIIMENKQIKSVGKFFLSEKPPTGFSQQFSKISIGLNHGAGITEDYRLMTWGYNIMNKLGFEQRYDEEKIGEATAFDDIDDQKFYYEPTNVEEFNKLFKNENLNDIQKKDENIKEGAATATPTPTPAAPVEKEKKKKEALEINTDNIITETQGILQSSNKYPEHEKNIINNEKIFKEKLKDLLKKFQVFFEQEQNAKKLKKVLHNQFKFKMNDKPLEIKLITSTTNKYPPNFNKYKKNYKALLTTLKIHPCYLYRIFEHNLMSQTDLYKVIKMLFSNIQNDKYSQLLLVILNKMILKKTVLKVKDKVKTEDFSLEKLAIINPHKNKSKILIKLFGRIWGLIFSAQTKYVSRQQLIAVIFVNYVYAKIGMKGSGNEGEKGMIVVAHPDDTRHDAVSSNLSVQNSRLDKIFNVIDSVIGEIDRTVDKLDESKGIGLKALIDVKLLEDSKDKDGKENESKKEKAKSEKVLCLNNISKLMVKETFFIMQEVLKADETKILEWIALNMGYVFFKKSLKILEDPESFLVIKGINTQDKRALGEFLSKFKSNFYSISHVLRYLLSRIMTKTEENVEDDVHKGVIKKLGDFKEKISPILFDIFSYCERGNLDRKVFEQQKLKMENFQIKYFFKNSMFDRNSYITFSLFTLKKLENVIKNNIQKLRILNESFDILDKVFFNKIKDLHIGLEGGLTPVRVTQESDVILNVKLKTRALAYAMPDFLMRCKSCKTMILEEFNLANDELFYDEFNFILKSSKEGALINLLRKVNLSELRQEPDFITILHSEVKNEDSQIKEDLYFLCSSIAVENKKELLLDEEDIGDKTKLFNIILNDKSTIDTIKKLCKNIKLNYDSMRIHLYYQGMLKDSISKVENELDRMSNSRDAKDALYERIRKNFEKGYGNPNIKTQMNSLSNSSMFVQLVKHIENLPKSDNLFEKLSKEKKGKILPFKEYEFKNLLNDGIITRVLLKNSDAELKPENYKFSFQKTDKSEFILTLIKEVVQKGGFFKCSINNKKGSGSSTKVHSVTLTNNDLSRITNLSINSIDNYYEISSFIEIDAKKFVLILKELTNIGLEDEKD